MVLTEKKSVFVYNIHIIYIYDAILVQGVAYIFAKQKENLQHSGHMYICLIVF